MSEARGELDVAIVGAGIGGVIALYCARRAGLRAHVFEAQPGVGGLWRQLPAWQDIQIAAADWTLGDLPLAGTFQPQILANIQAWVDTFDLARDISLSTPVRATTRPGGWTLATREGDVAATHLVVATGAHNRPFIPPVRRAASTLMELHSAAPRASLVHADAQAQGGRRQRARPVATASRGHHACAAKCHHRS
jgi:cation diffusion facilitator CzcD-associated flavoprotein CzcO